MAIKTWTGNSSTDWNTAGNWSTNSLPTNADDVVVGTTVRSPILNNSATVNTLTMNGTDTLQLGDANSGNSGGLTATSTTLSGGAQIFGQGSINGTVTAIGPATIALKAVNAQNTPQLTLNGTINDSGNQLTLRVSDTQDQLFLLGAGTNTVHTVDFNGQGGQLQVFNTALTVGSQMTIGNGQVFLPTAASLLTDTSGATIAAGSILGIGKFNSALTATGAATVTTNGGTLEMGGGITDTGNALTLHIVQPGDRLLLDGASQAKSLSFDIVSPGTLELNTGASLTLANQLSLPGGNVATVKLDGATLSDAGGISSNGATITGSGLVNGPVSSVNGLQVTVTGGTLEFSGNITDSNNTLTAQINAGTDALKIDGTAAAKSVTFSGLVGKLEVANNGFFTVNNALTVGGATVQLDGNNAKLTDLNNVSLGNNGKITGAGIVDSTVSGNGAASIVASGGTLELKHLVSDPVQNLTLKINGSSDTLMLDFNAQAQTVDFNGQSGTLELNNFGGSAMTVANKITVGTGTIKMDSSIYTLNDANGILLGFGLGGPGGLITGVGAINAPLSGSGNVRASGGVLELKQAIAASAGPTFQIANGAANKLLVDSTVGAGNTFAFLGSTGELDLVTDANFNDTISGFNVGSSTTVPTNFVDIKPHPVTISSVTGQGTTSGKITLSDGAVLNLTNISTPHWQVSTVGDGGTGTKVFLSQFGFDSNDFNGDSFGDVAWRNVNSGALSEYQMIGPAGQPSSVLTSPGVGTIGTDWKVIGLGDFDGDNRADFLWRNSNSNTVSLWEMDGAQVKSAQNVATVPSTFTAQGIGDFNGDGKADILWRDATGTVQISLMNGFSINSTTSVQTVGTDFSIVGVGDVDGDGKSDVVWRSNVTGALSAWEMNGAAIKNAGSISGPGIGTVGLDWTIAGVADFDGDLKSDILWRQGSTGNVSMYLLNGFQVKTASSIGTVPTDLTVATTPDVNGDGKADIVWRNMAGTVEVTQVNGTSFTRTDVLGTVGSDWNIVGQPTQNGPAGGQAADPANGGGDTGAGSMDLPTTMAGAAAPSPGPNAGAGAVTVSGGSAAGGGGSYSVVDGAVTVWGATGVSGGSGPGGSATVTGFSQSGGNAVSFPNETAAAISNVITSARNASGDTMLTLPDGSTLTLAGVNHIDSSFFR